MFYIIIIALHYLLHGQLNYRYETYVAPFGTGQLCDDNDDDDFMVYISN